MKKILPYLLYAEQQTYYYDTSKDLIINELEALFEKSGKFLFEPDFNAHFIHGDRFVLFVNSGAYVEGGGTFHGSTLTGEICEVTNGQTEVKVIAESSSSFKVITVILIIVGLLSFFTSFRQGSVKSLLISIGLIIVPPLIFNWWGGIANGVVQDRYRRYIDKALRKLKHNEPRV